MKKCLCILLASVACLGLISCSKKSEVDTSRIEVTKEVKEVSHEKKQMAPDFELLDLKGKKVTLKNYKGKTVVINFFNSWNVESIKCLPSLMKIGDTYRDKGLEMIYISPGERKEEILQYLNENPVSALNILLDTNGSTEKRYGVEAIPTTYIIDKEGHIFAKLAKSISEGELEELIKSLL